MKPTTYLTYTNQNAKIAVYAGMAILALCTVVPLALTPPEEISWHWGYLVPGGIIGFFIYVIVASFLKFFIRFTISQDGLTIRKPLFHKRFIRFDEIEQVILLDQDKTYDFFLNEVSTQYGLRDDSDLSTLIYKIRKESPAYIYLTITPRGSSSGSENAERLSSLHIEAEMLLIKLKDGQMFFLSPEKIQVFYDQLVKGIN
ncbi:hypothetical protein [Marinoscillum sp. MHG1-6]|uniref:hypothetical protein n=1 Tax=Marinoscillum sp. MHG1-6 TaxID=2959627 RepID=UPI0021588AD3|nr:hypothetical protein [Marinoscillum sp. MHG1-6]